MDVRFCEGRNHRREAHLRAVGSDRTEHCALLRSAPQENLFLLDFDWVENHVLMLGFQEVRLGNQEF